MIRFVLFNIIFLFLAVATAQTVDSTSIAPADTVSRTDTLRLRFIPGIGNLTGQTDTTSPLNHRAFHMGDFRTLIDVLRKEPGIFVRELGEAGKPQQLFMNGIDNRGIALMVDGRPMNDPFTGSFNLYHLPLESIDHLEVLQGGSETIGAGQASGGLINAVTTQYNTIRPITRIRFVQEPNDNILTDGVFTQNIARGTNLIAGFTRQVSNGRYKNSSFDSWILRLRVRSNFSERFNTSVAYSYTKANNGMHGGIDPTSTAGMFDEKLASLMTLTANDSYYRHDWTMNTVGRLFDDSASSTNAVAYISSIEQIYSELGTFLQPPFTTAHQRKYGGIRITQRLSLSWTDLAAGFHWERRNAAGDRLPGEQSESLTALFASAAIKIDGMIKPSLSSRLESLRGVAGVSANARVDLDVEPTVSVFGEALTGGRFPTMQEIYWRDSSFRSALSEREQFVEFRAGAAFRISTLIDLRAIAFRRTVTNMITASADTLAYPAVYLRSVPEGKVTGFTGDARIHIWNIELRGTASLFRTTVQGRDLSLYPDYIFYGEAAYVNSLLKGALDIRAGIRSRIQNRHQGAQMFPAAEVFYESTSGVLGRHYVTDVFGVFRIGQALVSLSWENITDGQYVLTAVYPMPSRHVKLGVNWVFND